MRWSHGGLKQSSWLIFAKRTQHEAHGSEYPLTRLVRAHEMSDWPSTQHVRLEFGFFKRSHRTNCAALYELCFERYEIMVFNQNQQALHESRLSQATKLEVPTFELLQGKDVGIIPATFCEELCSPSCPTWQIFFARIFLTRWSILYFFNHCYVVRKCCEPFQTWNSPTHHINWSQSLGSGRKRAWS